MDRMKGRMTASIFIIVLLLVSAVSATVFLQLYRYNYKKINLLRTDPLEAGGLKTENLEATLKNSEIWMLGDSRVSRWNEELLKNGTEIANLGIEGQTSAQVYYRFKTYLETDTPSLVILEVGINELKIIGLDKDLSPSITGRFYRNIESIIKICREKSIPIVVVNIFPVGNIGLSRRLLWNKSVNEAIKSANVSLQSYCDEMLVYYFDASSILSENGATVNIEYQYDFLHINDKGYEALSRELKGKINKIFNQQ